jgi:hypothetical protein
MVSSSSWLGCKIFILVTHNGSNPAETTFISILYGDFICEYCKKGFKSIYSLAAHKGHCKLIPNKSQRDYVTPAIKGEKN